MKMCIYDEMDYYTISIHNISEFTNDDFRTTIEKKQILCYNVVRNIQCFVK